MSTKTKPKPRVMWAWPSHLNARGCPIWASRSKMHRALTQSPVKVAVIPLDDVEALVERAAKAMCNRKEPHLEMWTHIHEKQREIYREAMRVSLTAAGIPCKQRRARK